jgi:hypothetical protein
VFASENFGSDIPGWVTDRGRIYVLYGPPDRVESHPREEPAWKRPEGGPDIPKYSWESWHYEYLEAIGKEADFEFVDPAGSGMYSLRVRQEVRDVLLFNSGYNLGGNPAARATPQRSGKIKIHVGPAPGPRVKHKDLEAIITTQIVREQVHFTHRIEFARATHPTTLARIMVDIPEAQLTIPEKD